MISKKLIMDQVPTIFKKTAGQTASLFKKGKPVFDAVMPLLPDTGSIGGVKKAAKMANCLERA